MNNHSISSDIDRSAIMPDTRKNYYRRKAEAGQYAVGFLFFSGVFILIEPFLNLPLLFMPELLLIASFWFVSAALSKVKIPKNYRCPPDYPKKRPLWFPRRRYRIERKRGIGNIYLGYGTDLLTQIWVTGKDQLQHIFGAGSTGSGKTVQILGKLFGYLINGSGTLLNDAKGTNEVYFQVLTMMRRMGCVEDLVLVNFLIGDQEESLSTRCDLKRVSNSLDIIGTGSPEMLRTIFMGLLRDSGSGDMWKAKVGVLLYGILVGLKDKQKRRLITFNLDSIRSFVRLEVYCLLFFDEEVSKRSSSIIVNYLSEAPNYSFDLAKYLLIKTAIELVEVDGNNSDPVELIWDKYKIRLNKLAVDTLSSVRGSDGRIEPMEAPHSESVFREQWGYLSMQLSESFQLLLFEYEHIFNNSFEEAGELSIPDLALDRKVCLQFMPTLEKDKDSFTMMAKIMMGSFRPLFMKGISANVNGKKEMLLDGMPTNARFPFAIDLDEYPQYGGKASGSGSAAALVRVMGFALSFFAQQFASLKKENEEEYTNVYGNTVNKSTGKLEDPFTIKQFSERGGKHFVARMDGYEEREEHASTYKRSKNIKIVEEDRIRSNVLTDLAAGQGFYIRGDTVVKMHFFGVLFDEKDHYKTSDTSALNAYVKMAELTPDQVEKEKLRITSTKGLVNRPLKQSQVPPKKINYELERLIEVYMKRPSSNNGVASIIALCATKSSEALSFIEPACSKTPVAQQELLPEAKFNTAKTGTLKSEQRSFKNYDFSAKLIDKQANVGADSVIQKILNSVNEGPDKQISGIISDIETTEDIAMVASEIIYGAESSESFKDDCASFNAEFNYIKLNNVESKAVENSKAILDAFISDEQEEEYLDE